MSQIDNAHGKKRDPEDYGDYSLLYVSFRKRSTAATQHACLPFSMITSVSPTYGLLVIFLMAYDCNGCSKLERQYLIGAECSARGESRFVAR